MTLSFIVGIDPGLSGGLAFLRNDGQFSVFDMPTTFKMVSGKKRRVIDRERLRQYFDRTDITHIVFEAQSTRQGESSSSALTIGRNFGLLEGLALANYHPYSIISPQSWKNKMQVPRDKKEAMARATQLMPRCAHRWANAGNDGRAEAALLALYAAMHIVGVTPTTIFTE